MSAIEFLTALSRQGITVWTEGDQLRYRAPKGTMTASLRTQLTAYKDELRILLSPKREGDLLSMPFLAPEKLDVLPASLVPVARTQEIPLSFTQQALWFLDRLHTQSTAYMFPMGLRLQGPLNIRALEQSLQEMVHRHEILRTTFIEHVGHPVQMIHPQLVLPLPVVDMHRIEARKHEQLVNLFSQQEAQKPCDLAVGPLLSTILLRSHAQEHVLLLTLHHLIGDGGSLVVWLEELAKLYEAFSKGLPPLLPALPIQYADFAVWQRKRAQEGKLKRQLDYWAKQLDGLVALELPTDHPRPPIQTFQGAHQSFLLPLALVESLKAFSRRENATLFMTLLAALQTLLFRYTGQTDVGVGMTIANRLQPETVGLIGFFANTVVMRSNLSKNPSFRILLSDVRKVVIESLANQDISFEEIVAKLQPERQLSQSPFFQVELTLRSPFPDDIYLDHTLVTPFSVESGTAKFDLAIEMMETARGLNMVMEYNTALFEASTIHRMLESYQTLLEGIITNPDQHLNALPLLTESERHTLLVTWNTLQASKNTEFNYSHDQCLHHLFEAQVQHAPEAVAVVFEHEQLTYQELNTRANQLAHYLQGLGVGPEVLVGVCMERSLDLIVALLGILKAGGAYVPLDPDYPQERLTFMLEDSQVSVLLTHDSLRERLLAGQAQILCLDSEESLIAQAPTTSPESGVQPYHLAYVIYTSGSTGKPKGAMVEQRGMLNHIYAKIEALGLSANDTLAQTASQCFDISVWQFLAPLVVGGRVQIYPNEIAHDAQQLLQQVELQQVSILETVPALLQAMLDVQENNKGDQQSQLKALRWQISTGEALSVELCRRWLQRYPHVPLLNAYGPTECSDDVTHYVISQPPAAEQRSIPIGRVICNMQLYVLDQYLQPVPIGVSGELYIGGIGVGRGYLGDEQRTLEAFVANPFTTEEGARFYKTGDLTRYLPDGSIEFLGRLDHQVKIRGHRIELGEIEATLQKHPHVRDAVVLVREDTVGDKSLVAYVIEKGSDTLLGDLRSYLQTRLPEYMVPAFYVLLESFPLTANGKLDRKSLPVPQVVTSIIGSSSVARTPIEEIVQALYQEILGLEQINLHESFFNMGGHSLLATQIVSRIRMVLGIEVSLRTLFETPSVAGLARQVEHSQRSQQERVLPPIIAAVRTQDLPLSFAQQRLWIQEQLTLGHSAYGLPIVVKLQGTLNIAILEKSVREIVQRHESLRTTFVTRAGKPVQQITMDQHIQLVVADLQVLEQDKQTARVLNLLQVAMLQPFDLASGPLLRAGVFVLQEQEYIFYLVMHHIIFDAWSTGVFFRELSTLYNAFLQGKPSPLLPPPFQYADFALWQRGWLERKVLDTLVDYWTQQLRGAQSLELPTDRPRTALLSNQGSAYLFELPSQLTQKLIALSRQEGVTLFMTLLTTFQILLHAYTGLLDIVVGTDIANRTSTETEDMIGFFINLLVLRTQLDTQNTFRETLKSVCATVLHAYTHQDLPFDQLVDALQLQRSPYQIPLVNILFVLQNIPLNLLALHDVTADPMDTAATTAKFDVSVFLVERGSALTGYVNYRTDLFHPATIARMMKHFEILLWDVVDVPDKLIEELNMLTEEEKEQKLQDVVIRRETQRSRLKSAKRRITTVSESKLQGLDPVHGVQ